jgi:hypothetical protein
MIICDDCKTTIIPTIEKAYCRCGKTSGYKIDNTIYYYSIASLVCVTEKGEVKIQILTE